MLNNVMRVDILRYINYPWQEPKVPETLAVQDQQDEKHAIKPVREPKQHVVFLSHSVASARGDEHEAYCEAYLFQKRGW